jgi:hypothetical protein
MLSEIMQLSAIAVWTGTKTNKKQENEAVEFSIKKDENRNYFCYFEKMVYYFIIRQSNFVTT